MWPGPTRKMSGIGHHILDRENEDECGAELAAPVTPAMEHRCLDIMHGPQMMEESTYE